MLLASVDKFGNRLFMGALYSKPADCISLLQLAASGGGRLKVMENCLKQMQGRLSYLLDALVRHLAARRAGQQRLADAPQDFPSLQAATQQLCALCAALDRAPPLEFPRARLSIREWLREHLELALQREVSRLMFPGDGAELAVPADALARLHDLTTALSMLRNFVNVDVQTQTLSYAGPAAALTVAEPQRTLLAGTFGADLEALHAAAASGVGGVPALSSPLGSAQAE